MAYVICARLGMLAAGPLCSRLQRLIPGWHWSCVAPHSVGDYHLLEDGVPLMVNGHNGDSWIRLEIHPHEAPLPASLGAPIAHGAHVVLELAGNAAPSAMQAAQALCLRALLNGAGSQALALLPGPGEAVWHNENDIAGLASQLLSDSAPAEPAAAGLWRHDRLPTLALLAAAPAPVDWALLAETLRLADTEGQWRLALPPVAEAPSAALLARVEGHGCAITIAWQPQPIGKAMLEAALAVSFWIEPGAASEALAAAAGHYTLSCDLDTSRSHTGRSDTGQSDTGQSDANQGDAATARQCAKAMALALAVMAGHVEVAGVLNLATLSAFAPAQLPMLMAPLESDEVPIALFVASRLAPAAPGHVSLTSLGMTPFIGMEVEVVNTPGELDALGETVNRVLRYLLAAGPVIGDGDTLGDEDGQPMIRAQLAPAQLTPTPAHAPLPKGAPLPKRAKALRLVFLPPAGN